MMRLTRPLCCVQAAAALSIMSMHCNPIIFALNFLVSGHGVMVIYLSFIPTHPLVRNFSKKKKSNSWNELEQGSGCKWTVGETYVCMKVVLATGIRYDNEWQAGSWTLVLFISLKIHFIFAFCKLCFYQLFLEHVSGDLCGSLMRLTHLVICRKCTIKLFPYFDVVYNWLLLHFVHMCPSNVQKSLDFFEIVLWT